MKLLTAIFLLSFTMSAQIEKPIINVEKTIVKKKSYKNIIEKTLSGEKYLIFKIKRETKTC